MDQKVRMEWLKNLKIRSEFYFIACTQDEIGLDSGCAEDLFSFLSVSRFNFKFIAKETQRPAGYVNPAAYKSRKPNDWFNHSR